MSGFDSISARTGTPKYPSSRTTRTRIMTPPRQCEPSLPLRDHSEPPAERIGATWLPDPLTASTYCPLSRRTRRESRSTEADVPDLRGGQPKWPRKSVTDYLKHSPSGRMLPGGSSRLGVIAMTLRDTPPFRADHVGSLLRPRRLLEARQQRADGKIDADEL